MRTLGNILWWIPCCGFVPALLNLLFGFLLTLTVVFAPLGLGVMQLGKFLLAPFSQAMVTEKRAMPNVRHGSAWKTLSIILLILYLPFGLFTCVAMLCSIIFYFFTIIFIPLAIVLAKALSTCFNPIGKVCVPIGVKELMDRKDAEAMYEQYCNRGKTPDAQPEEAECSAGHAGKAAMPRQAAGLACNSENGGKPINMVKIGGLEEPEAKPAAAETGPVEENRTQAVADAAEARPHAAAVNKAVLIKAGIAAAIVLLYAGIGYAIFHQDKQEEVKIARVERQRLVPREKPKENPKDNVGIRHPAARASAEQPAALPKGMSPEQLAHASGVWRGAYTAPQGKTGLTLIVKEKNGKPYCLFTFYPIRENPGVESGQYAMSMNYDNQNGEYKLTATEWIKRGGRYEFANLSGKVEGKHFAGNVYSPSGQKIGYFSLQKR